MYVHRMSREIVIQYKHAHYFILTLYIEALAVLSIVIKLYILVSFTEMDQRTLIYILQGVGLAPLAHSLCMHFICVPTAWKVTHRYRTCTVYQSHSHE